MWRIIIIGLFLTSINSTVILANEHLGGDIGPEEFIGDLAIQHIADQVAFGPRPTGSPVRKLKDNPTPLTG